MSKGVKNLSSSERQRSRQRTRNLFVNTIKTALKKPEKLTVSQWAEKYRILDESSNFSGRWSNDITPYLVGIMDAFNDPYIQEINFCKPTQVGGTEAMLNMLGWIIMDWCCIIKVDTLFSRILIYNHNQYENRRKTYGTESKIL